MPRVGDAVAKKLANLGARRVGELLTLSPRRHIDYSRTVKIGSILGFGQRDEVTVKGEVIDLKVIPGPSTTRVTIRLADDTGWVRVTWFNSFIAKQIQPGDVIAVSGLLETGYGPPSFTSPEWERHGGPALSTGRLIPVYPLTQGLAQKTLRNLTRAALDATRTTVTDFQPAAIREEYRLAPLLDAYESLHYPATWTDLAAAQDRLAFDNLFLLQLGLVRRKQRRVESQGIRIDIAPGLVERFVAQLPFSLTSAQRQALAEIVADLKTSRPMARLLQGDVGSGKTVVAAAAAYADRRRRPAGRRHGADRDPRRAALPQPARTLRGIAGARPADRRVADRKQPRRRAATSSCRRLAAGEIDVLVGTHALIQEAVDLRPPRVDGDRRAAPIRRSSARDPARQVRAPSSRTCSR